MRHTLWLASLVVLLSSAHAFASDAFLVKDGQPQAEIVIAAEPPRSTRLAARELQTYIEKISGARLPIVSQPTGDAPVQVFVGESAFTRERDIDTAGLKEGAYRIVSGDDWLVLIGDDTNFQPIEPWPRGNSDIASGRMQKAWDAITGEHWGFPHSQLHKHYTGSNGLFGTANEQLTDADGNVHVWTFDERGSFNAVCGFLRSLGVRWYMPGELGEIVPRQSSIALPQIDETVHPDFPLRCVNFRTVHGRDALMWSFRLGTRQPFGRQAAHGLHNMTDNPWTLEHHPEWFALYGGKRHTDPRVKNNQLCYSNEELLQEAVRFARVQFDHCDMDVVSIMPPDGYTAICQCEKCRGKESPELGERGSLSNYVWDFVNRVAREVAKTHPGKKISNCAYGVYTTPPNNIDRLEPNVQVIIVGGRRPTDADREALRALREGWAAKTDNPIEIFENYPFTGRGFYLPAYIPRVLGESINASKGLSRGEDIWLTMDFGEDAIGFNHFLVYFTSRMYWGGKDQDVVAMFDEYCRLFYGPAAGEMQEFFRYCEEHWRDMERDGERAQRALDLFAVAKEAAPEESVYGQRIGLVDRYLEGLRNKSIQLAKKRGPVPRLRLVSGTRGTITVDGRLDDEPWQEIPTASTGGLRELQTGRLPTFGTTFMVEWIGNDLYVAIRCDEQPGEPLNITATRDGDRAIWYGDVVEVLLATESHEYYQLAVSPSGALVDLDRGTERARWFDWRSLAEVATQVAEDHWTVELRIPITADDNDPLHRVIGRKPTQSLPWHINICRQRVRDTGTEHSAFAPTGKAGFHEPLKFAHFHAGRSHRFEEDSSVSDFIIERSRAEALMRRRDFEGALSAFIAMAEGEDVTEFQRSDALELAASCARALEQHEQADELAKQIPLASVADTVQMENLLARRDYQTLIDEFGERDLRAWPFWQIGAGAAARARAFAAMKAGTEAEADLELALAFTADPRIRTSLLATLGHVRETLLGDEAGALAAYRKNFASRERIAAADEFRSVQGAARILSRQGKHEEALAALERAEAAKLSGFWRGAMLVATGDALAAAERREEAIEVYRQAIASEGISGADQRAAQEAIEALEKE